MYPVLAKVRYGELGRLRARGKLFGVSLFLNWVVGPVLMFALAWLLLPDLPHYRTGLILIGLARCIAMVLIWNMLACGSNEMAARAGGAQLRLPDPLLLGARLVLPHRRPRLARRRGDRLRRVHVEHRQERAHLPRRAAGRGGAHPARTHPAQGRGVVRDEFLPRLGPTALLGLLYTIVLMFAMQGEKITRLPLDVVRISLPLMLYFIIMFASAFFLSRKLGFSYEETASLSFTAAGNNFELAIAVAVGVFGMASGEALAGVVGPLIEVPALIALVYLSLWLRRRLFPQSESVVLPRRFGERKPASTQESV